jgi:hypothetical protein
VASHPVAELPERPGAHRTEVGAALTAIYSWNYEPEIDALRTLYANALERQWIGLRDLDWETGIDREAVTRTFNMGGVPVAGTRFWQGLPFETRWQVARTSAAFMLSNFLHGEQGALMVAGQLVNAVPHMDGKFYAATQTLDEARHVEVFAAYIKLLDEVVPIMPALKKLLDTTLGHESWIHKAVGMNIVVEGLALFVFRDMRNTTEEPLLKQLLTYVSRDEARHCAFGVKYVARVVARSSDTEKRALEDFAFEAARMLVDSRSGSTMRDSMLKVWGDLGLDPASVFAELAKERDKIAPGMQRTGGFGPVRGFIIPTLRSIGLFSERIEGHFREMFVGNFGLKQGSRMEFGGELPQDLMAWVESTS